MFKVGQQVIALKDHRQGFFKKDDVFTIIDIRVCCTHSPPVLNVGLKNRTKFPSSCEICDSYVDNENYLYFDPCHFAPIESQYKQITYYKVLEEVEVCEN